MTHGKAKGDYDKCGAKRRGGPGMCRRPAGWGTDHSGQGKCKLHGGASPIKHGRYSSITRDSIRLRLAEQDKLDIDPLDLVPDLKLCRALLTDYIDRYSEFTDALQAWHLSFVSPDVTPKPRQILDLADASHLLERVSRIVERIYKIKSEGSISLETFKRLMEQMGLSVARHVDADTCRRIEQDWLAIRIDGKPSAGD